MPLTYKVPKDKRMLYLLGELLIDYRHPVSVIVIIITSLFAYWSFQLRLVTSFGDLLPQTHPYIKIHNKYSKDFGGANNIVMMVEVEKGNLFTVENLAQIYLMTEEIDKIYGVNHNQIDSIGHRTTRHLKVAAGGTLRAEPVMIEIPANEAEAAEVRRIVHNSENVFGILVSLDDRAAIIRANFIEGRLDYRRIFEEMNERVLTPHTSGWVGAQIIEVDPDRHQAFGVEQGTGLIVKRLFPNSAAAASGLQANDVITAINGKPATKRYEVGNAVAGGIGAEIDYLRGGKPAKLTLKGAGSPIKVWSAGEPRLYGWVYNYAGDVFFILVITYCIEWVLRWLYFHDWRGSLRPTITGLIAAFWGLGFVYLIGLALDPLMLVMPFLITARAVSHAIQMHDRYYEEFEKCGWNKRRAIVASFAELFVPTFSGVVTDALGVLVILLVPVIMLQKLAITASWWILAITVSEMLLNPIVYYYLKAPEPELVVLRERGAFRYYTERFVDALLSTTGRWVTVVGWIIVVAIAGWNLQGLTIGDPGSASPLVFEDSPYNASHRQIQGKFGGVEPLIVVNEGYDKDAMKDPHTLKTMEKFQRFLERDPSVGYSFSLSDILRAVNSVFHELEPKWGVIPNNWVDIGGLFFIFFSGSPPTETAKYVSTDYATAHVTFFCKDHKGDNIKRIIGRSKEYILGSELNDLGIEVEQKGEDAVVITKVAESPKWQKAEGSWIVKPDMPGGEEEKAEGEAEAPFNVGDKIVAVGDLEVTNIAELREALSVDAGRSRIVDFKLDKGGKITEATLEAPWKAVLKLAGGLIGVLAAANEELVRNDLLMNFLGFFTIWVTLLFTYRSVRCGLYLLAPMMCSNLICNAVMAYRNIGINVHTLPLVTVGIGFGVDYGMYMASRIIEEIRIRGDIVDSTREAMVTTGKAITFTAVTMVLSTSFWVYSNIRFNAEMGLLLAIWMGIGYIGAQTLLPVMFVTLKPAFIMREANRLPDRVDAKTGKV